MGINTMQYPIPQPIPERILNIVNLPIETRHGFCMCGCGREAPISTVNHARLAYVKGQPIRYIGGHSSRKLGRRYAEDPETGCWIFRAKTDGGYARVSVDGGNKNQYAHRIMYEVLVGSVPAGMELDHICRNRACINPSHLEPVLHRENTRRGVSAKLDGNKVRAIRRLSLDGNTQRSIAKQFGVSQASVWQVIHKTSWVDISDE